MENQSEAKPTPGQDVVDNHGGSKPTEPTSGAKEDQPNQDVATPGGQSPNGTKQKSQVKASPGTFENLAAIWG